MSRRPKAATPDASLAPIPAEILDQFVRQGPLTPEELDTAVRRAYGMKESEDILAFLLKLNLELADKETKGEPITPPGLPAFVPKPADFVSADCVTVPEEK